MIKYEYHSQNIMVENLLDIDHSSFVMVMLLLATPLSSRTIGSFVYQINRSVGSLLCRPNMKIFYQY